MSYAMDRYQAAAETSPLGEGMFTAAFLGALSVGYDPHGKTDAEAWDRCLLTAENAVNKIATEQFNRAAERGRLAA